MDMIKNQSAWMEFLLNGNAPMGSVLNKMKWRYLFLCYIAKRLDMVYNHIRKLEQKNWRGGNSLLDHSLTTRD